jgi:signal transduction histidine kinase
MAGGAMGDIPAQMQELLTVANNNTERLLFLINDILDMQKIESDDLDMAFEEMAVYPFLEQAIKDNVAYAEQYGVKLVLEPLANNILINANKARLMQVMANLISNSAKFSHRNSVVEIAVSQPNDNMVRISVTDHGAGISKEFYPKIFERFTQQDSSDTRNKGGTGLGLNITKAIIEKHGGEIGFTSTEGEGTTFYFNLPVKTN